MRRTAARFRTPLPLFGASIGVVLLAFLVRRADLAHLSQNLARLGWGLALVIALAGVSHVLKTWAWELTLTDEKRNISFARLFGLRLAAEAGGQIGIIGQIFGDGFRVSLLSQSMPMSSALSSVTLDRGLFIATGAITSTVGVAAALVALPLSHAWRLSAALFLFVLIAALAVVGLALRKRWPMFSRTARLLCRVRYLNGWVENKYSVIVSAEKKFLDFHHDAPEVFWGSLTLNLACHLMAAFEVYLILWLLGCNIRIFGALTIEALTKLVNTAGTFNPGNVGTYEGGNMLIAKLFGFTGATGLALGLSRRLRALFWTAVGIVCALVMMSKSKSNARRTSSSLTAVILADNCQNNSECMPLLRVGSLPVLLRTILGAQKAGAGRIIVVVDRLKGSKIKGELVGNRRLPECIEFFETDAHTPLSRILGDLAADVVNDPLVLIAGDRTYHPALLRQARQWNGEQEALALVTGNQPAGIYALRWGVALDVTNHFESSVRTLEELHGWLTANNAVQSVPVRESLWQHVIDEETRISAERKLDQWLVKPTDGIFARMNRKVSIRISRQVINFPITPNMVTLFTLAVSLVSGLLFACGGYLDTLAGALLSVFASILDGCDGEVARLKLQESDFGCWLETICDYLYYLFIFGGLTIGLLRSTETRTVLIWGSLLLFGAVASFVATGYSRHRLAAGRPEQLLGIWQRNAENRPSNPLLYFGRHTEFIIRRCFMPYAILFFALLNITNVVFVLAAVGANLVWVIALYSYWTFAVARRSVAA